MWMHIIIFAMVLSRKKTETSSLHCLHRLFETLQSLFWSIFGLLNLYVTNVKARHEFTEFVGATMFGTYNVISLVVLLNMLIAMMNNSYQLIAVSHLNWTNRFFLFYRYCAFADDSTLDVRVQI